jgi:putative transposase
MNNHVHILFVPQHESSLAKTMQKLSLRYTQHVNKKYKRTGRLWECRFHSAVVDKDAYLWSVSRYIERNPVRAKIVQSPCQYKWSSAGINDDKNNFIESFWQNSKERKEYVNFLNQPDNKDEIQKIKKSTFSGKPIGTEEFIDKIVETLGIAISTRKRGRPHKNKK